MGVGGVIALGAILKKKREEKRQEQIKNAIREYFSRFGSILVLYLNAYESDAEKDDWGSRFRGRSDVSICLPRW